MLQSTSYPQMAHRMKCWAPRRMDQRNHPGTGRDVRCMRSKRSVGCARRRGSYSNPQISQSVSRRSSARARETSRGCQSFHKEIATKSCSYAHNRRMSHPRTHLQHVGSPDTEDNDRVRHPQTGNDRNQKDTDETAS